MVINGKDIADNLIPLDKMNDNNEVLVEMGY